jgi:Dolichyl-phosphate-mannose-protein mannosyltransferase
VAETAVEPRPRAFGRATARELDRRLFAAGVAAVTAATGAFLLVQLNGWPPHEDETLPLFVGRESLGDLFHTVLGKRGGAPLHFLLAWIVAHAGGGLETMRFFSALFATASLPAIAVLGNRLAGRGPALAATALAAGSWVLLFHGIYARMYSLFLFLATLSYLALLRALDRGGRAWILWGIVMLLAIASHPYGALVLGSQGLYVLVTQRRLRQAIPAFATVFVLAIPLWRSSLVLANRFDVGVGGGGGGKLRTPREVLAYLWRVAGDSSTGYAGALVVVLVLAAIGLGWLARERSQAALLTACVVLTPTLFFLVGRFGGNTAPESRHLIFVLPFLALAAASGILAVTRAAPYGGWLAALVVIALLPFEVAWSRHKTPALFDRENPVRVDGRHAAATWLGATSRPNDVLFAFEPLYLAAWERNRSGVSRTVVPRADPKLALQALDEAKKPLGRAVFVFDAGDNNNYVKRTRIEFRLPFPRSEFEGRAYGPYLVIRTRRPTVTIARYLDAARKAELIGKSLAMGDADINYATIRQAQVRLVVRSLSRVSS